MEENDNINDTIKFIYIFILFIISYILLEIFVFMGFDYVISEMYILWIYILLFIFICFNKKKKF